MTFRNFAFLVLLVPVLHGGTAWGFGRKAVHEALYRNLGVRHGTAVDYDGTLIGCEARVFEITPERIALRLVFDSHVALEDTFDETRLRPVPEAGELILHAAKPGYAHGWGCGNDFFGGCDRRYPMAVDIRMDSGSGLLTAIDYTGEGMSERCTLER